MRIGFLLAGAMLVLSAQAKAEDCGKLNLVASVSLVQTQHDATPYVPAEINHAYRLLLLDTGSSMSALTPRAAKKLHLKGMRSGIRLFDRNGNYSDQFVETPLAIGNIHGDKVKLMIAPEGQSYGADPRVAGVLGADILAHYDVSMDFAGHKLDLIDQNHCPGNAVYWPATVVAVVPFEQLQSGQILLPVKLDGRTTKAILDTGSAKSTLTRSAAESAYGLKMGSPDTPVAGTLNGGQGTTFWHHTFKTLTFEGVSVSNPQIRIVPDRAGKHFNETQVVLVAGKPAPALAPAVVLGMDVLRHLHVYIAYKARKLYITPAQAPKSAK